jgi:c-di-GMP-binding flagellar brake protein YcgR
MLLRMWLFGVENVSDLNMTTRDEHTIDDRRKFARLDIALTVSYAPLDRHGGVPAVDPRDALTADISAVGCV